MFEMVKNKNWQFHPKTNQREQNGCVNLKKIIDDLIPIQYDYLIIKYTI